MKELFDTYRPEGFQTINLYLFSPDPFQLIIFLKGAFYAEEINRTIDKETGTIANCILRIGTSCFMISQARGDFENMRTTLYLFTKDVDHLHENALNHGAEFVFSPTDMDYGDRQSGVKDPDGNYWWISKRLEEKGYQD